MLHYASLPMYCPEFHGWFGHARGQVAKVSRRQLELWLGTPAAQEAGVEVRDVARESWFLELAKYRFLLSPLGDGIQSTKTVEALLVLTVPIVQRGIYATHDDLVRLGFPIVVVDEWSEVSPGSLKGWWQALAPRLEGFRRRCLSTEGYWRLITGEIDHCH
mmetsp:Transcript_103712/g.334351  ORF Transcript_103712/g.334351 Transcript_103712/m.334351 type:complete len:161 (-) Transcript_103712:73-555(-)